MPQEKVSTLDAEIAVAGSILIDPKSYGRVAEILTEDSFRFDVPKHIFQVASELDVEGKAIDPMTIKARLSEHGWGVENNTLFEYMEITPTSANDTQYAEIVLNHAKRRKFKAIAGKMMEDSGVDLGEMIANAAGELEKLSRSDVQGRVTSSNAAVSRFYESLER